MYVYNVSDIACCHLFPSSLTEKALAWYAHLPREVFQTLVNWARIYQTFLSSRKFFIDI